MQDHFLATYESNPNLKTLFAAIFSSNFTSNVGIVTVKMTKFFEILRGNFMFIIVIVYFSQPRSLRSQVRYLSSYALLNIFFDRLGEKYVVRYSYEGNTIHSFHSLIEGNDFETIFLEIKEE